ncbi:uncharacterized protein [Eurosta solidaginis]|uniref:uncharacterized protein n=1 Tax=Eurosta solidaginis TaxID=178769 RepID=UPI003530D22D
MGKVNKKIGLKAKTALSKAAAATNDVKAKIQRATAKADDTIGRDEKLLLPKTPSPKKRAITKREKVRQKHKNLMNKFALLKKQRKENAARKNREKTAVIGDLKPLKDALPSLNELFKLSKKNSDIKTGIKEIDEPGQLTKSEKKLTVNQKIKKKKEKFIRQVSSYQALLKDPDFKKNPRDAISYHIKYTHGLIDE